METFFFLSNITRWFISLPSIQLPNEVTPICMGKIFLLNSKHSHVHIPLISKTGMVIFFSESSSTAWITTSHFFIYNAYFSMCLFYLNSSLDADRFHILKHNEQCSSLSGRAWLQKLHLHSYSSSFMTVSGSCPDTPLCSNDTTNNNHPYLLMPNYVSEAGHDTVHSLFGVIHTAALYGRSF